MALCPGLSGWAGTRKVNQSGFYWSKKQWVAVASDNHANTPPLGLYRLDAETTASKNQKSWKQICGADALVGD